MWVEAFTGGLPSNGGWTEFLRFTTAEAEAGDDMLPGTRIPAVFVNNEGYIGVRSQVGDDANFAKNINIVHIWNIIYHDYILNFKKPFFGMVKYTQNWEFTGGSQGLVWGRDF